MKVCKKCGIKKELTEFHKRKTGSKDGHRTECSLCYCNIYKNKNKVKSNYYLNNLDKIKKYNKEYHKKNLVKLKEKRKTDPLFKLSENTRSLIRKSIIRNGFSKKSKTYDILGCSYNEFKLYLESKFEPWMNWNNNGKYTGNYNETWQLDHIIPLESAQTEEELIKLNHYSNFQPLCSRKNQYDKKCKLDYYI